jgi:hypothetical protein
MKSEMIKFVSDNFEVIKDNFYKSELNILEEMFEDGINDKEEFDYLSEFLINQMNVSTAKELIDVINDRSIGVDLDGEEVIELFNMIKLMNKIINK